jgi:hypothetical protein
MPHNKIEDAKPDRGKKKVRVVRDASGRATLTVTSPSGDVREVTYDDGLTGSLDTGRYSKRRRHPR